MALMRVMTLESRSKSALRTTKWLWIILEHRRIATIGTLRELCKVTRSCRNSSPSLKNLDLFRGLLAPTSTERFWRILITSLLFRSLNSMNWLRKKMKFWRLQMVRAREVAPRLLRRRGAWTQTRLPPSWATNLLCLWIRWTLRLD